MRRPRSHAGSRPSSDGTFTKGEHRHQRARVSRVLDANPKRRRILQTRAVPDAHVTAGEYRKAPEGCEFARC